MSQLSPEALSLHGGCDCSSIKYTIAIPPLKERPILILAENNNGQVDVRPPELYFDHCNKCRKVSGAIVQCWLNCPQAWVTWSLSSQDAAEDNSESRILQSTNNVLENKPVSSLVMAHYKSSPDVSRYFCSRCGTNLVYVFEGKGSKDSIPMIDIVLGSLDKKSLETEGVRPDRHFYWSHGVDWVKSIIGEGDSTLNGHKLPRHPDGSRKESI